MPNERNLNLLIGGNFVHVDPPKQIGSGDLESMASKQASVGNNVCLCTPTVKVTRDCVSAG